MDLYFLDHLGLCFFWTLGIINNHITEKSLYFKNGPAIILRKTVNYSLKEKNILVNTYFDKTKQYLCLIVAEISCPPL